MSLHFKRYDYAQPYLLPPSLQDWLPPNHLAFFVCDVLDEMDLSTIYNQYGTSGRGQPGYDPLILTRLLVYGYCTGVYSSRRIERATHEDVAFRVVAANQHPDHDTIATFRKKNLPELDKLFEQVLQLCDQAGLVELGHAAVDGTKIKANASKHKAMSYERMKKREKEIQEQVRRMLEEAERIDAEEDARYGKGNKGWGLPKELQDRQKRLQKIREGIKALKERAQKKAAEKQEKRSELEQQVRQDEDRELGGRRPKIDPEPDPKTQRNFTDPESCLMKGPDGYVQAYNAQAMVDQKNQIIVASDLSNVPSDAPHVVALVRQAKKSLGRHPDKLSMDAGCYSQHNVRMLTRRHIDVYAATQRQKHTDKPQPPPRGRIPKSATIRDRMKRKLQTKKGQQIYRRRKTIVEPVFGQIKNRGFRRFSFRGMQQARQEWRFVCGIHNLMKLYRARKIENPN